MIVAPVTVRLVSGVVEPLAPVKLTVPVPAVIVNGPAPSTVVEKLTFAPAVELPTVLSVTVPPTRTVPVAPMTPDAVVTLLLNVIADVAAVLVKEIAPNGTVWPTVDSTIFPEPALNVSICDPDVVPFTAPENEILLLLADVVI